NQVQQIVQVFKSIKEKDSSSVLFLTADKENNNIESVYSILTKNGNPSILMTRSLRNCDKELNPASLINKGIKLYGKVFREPVSYRREYLVNELKPNLKDILINYAVLNKNVYNECTIDKIVNIADEFTNEFEKSKFDLYIGDVGEHIKSAASSDLAVIIPNSGGAEKESIFDDTYALFEWWTNRELYGIKKQDKCSKALNKFEQEIHPDNIKNSDPLNGSKRITWQKKYYSLIKKLSEDLIEYWNPKSEASKRKLSNSFEDLRRELLGYFRDSSTSFNERGYRELEFHLICLGQLFTKGTYSVRNIVFDKENNLFIIRKRFRDNIDILTEYMAEYSTRFIKTGPSGNKYNKNSINLQTEEYKSILKKKLLLISKMNSCLFKLIDGIENHRKFHTGIKTLYGYNFISTNNNKIRNIIKYIDGFDQNSEIKTAKTVENEMDSLFNQFLEVFKAIRTEITEFDISIISKIHNSKETLYEISLALGSLIQVVNIIQKGNDGMLIDVQDEIFYYINQIANRYTPEKTIPICNDLFQSYLEETQRINRDINKQD
ncbi:hypothetical protein BB560_006075, partial [Smittium megazygosporum]